MNLPEINANEARMVRLRIVIPADPQRAMHLLFPNANRAATVILKRLLVTRLKADGVNVLHAISALPFNMSSFLFALSNDSVGKALNIIEQEITEIGVLPMAQIAWFDWAELVWRMHWPKEGKLDVPSEEEIALEVKIREGIQRLNRC